MLWNLIVAVIVGFIVGLIARALMPGNQSMGFFATALLGMAGSVLASYGGGQRKSLERGAHTRSKKNAGKRPHQG